jgi:hypothetical protein
MSDYRRYFVPGGTYFFTVVTECRARLFGQESARRLLGDVMRQENVRYGVPDLRNDTKIVPVHSETPPAISTILSAPGSIAGRNMLI